MAYNLGNYDGNTRKAPKNHTTYTGAEGRRRVAEARAARAHKQPQAIKPEQQGLGLWLYASTGRHAAGY